MMTDRGSVLQLTPNERDRFATWLEQEAAAAEGMAKQAETLPHMDALVRRLRVEAGAALIIARSLRQSEDMTL